MLGLAEIIRAAKTDVDIGPWKSGKISNAAFPIGRTLPYGASWDWRVVQFNALGEKFRVLILLNEELEKYSAVLAMESLRGLLIICHHELHTSHRLWHCHFIHGNVRDTYPNVLRDKDRMKSWPSSGGKGWVEDFPVSKANALALAARRYRFELRGDLL